MSDISIRFATSEDDLDIVQDMTTYAFVASPAPERDKSRRDYFKISRKYILEEDGKPISTLDSIPMTQNVRGKIYPMQGIAGVATYPEGRRKGYVKKLIQKSFLDEKEAGNVFSTLYPFKQSFYGKFGYVTFPQARNATFKTANLNDINRLQTTGKVERKLVKENIDRFYNFLLKYQKKKHGIGVFKKRITESLEKANFWIAFANINGRDEGLFMFKTGGFEKEIDISAFLYLNSNAKYLLLQHLALHVDQFPDVKMRIFADERPESWAYDLGMNISSREWVACAMGRVLDISKIGGMQVGEGEISVNILDEHCPWNNGTWKFTTNKGFLQVEETDSASIEMTIQGISALIYGGIKIEDIIIRGWLECKKEQIDILLSLFPERIPVLYSTF